MIFYRNAINNWFNSGSRERLNFHIQKAIREMSWLSCVKAKYLTVRIDMRTGDFLLLDRNGEILSQEDIQRLFHNLEIKDFFHSIKGDTSNDKPTE